MQALRKVRFLVISLILVLTIFSCKKNDKFRFDLSDSIEYLETPSYYNIGNIMQHRDKFQKLEKEQFIHINKLVQKKGDYLWLRINFEVPDDLKSKQIGILISQLNTADLVFFNNTPLRMYGSFSPNFMPSGFQTQFFMLPITLVKQYGENTLLIQMSTEAPFSFIEPFFLGEQADVFRLSEIKTFFNSRILLAFTALIFIIFIVFFAFWIQLRDFDESHMFFSFSMLLFYTIHFLIPFFICEIPWAKPQQFSYITTIKFFFGLGAFTTIYFANSFIVHYLSYKESLKIIVIRFVLWLIPTVSIFFFNTIESMVKMIPVFTLFAAVQFGFSLPRLFMAFGDPSKKKNAILLLVAFIPVDICVTVDLILRGVQKIYSMQLFTLYGWQITVLIFLLYLIRNFANMYKHNNELKVQLVDFNAHLEDIVAIRTKEIAEANFILSRGLETISHVQKNFLPPQTYVLRGWEIAVAYKALDHDVSGDLYDYYYTNHTLDGLGIFDVSGHGIPAGLMTILAKGIISQHFINGVANSESMEEVLQEINKSYIKEKVNVENYITGLLFRFSDFNQKDICSIEVANAGHPYPLVYSNSEDRIFDLKYADEDKPFGLIGIEDYKVSFPPASCRMSVGDILVCFTDGITEALNPEKEDFGRERLTAVIEQNKELSAIELKNKIIEELTRFMGEEEIHDDITLMVLKRTPSNDFVEEL